MHIQYTNAILYILYNINIIYILQIGYFTEGYFTEGYAVNYINSMH